LIRLDYGIYVARLIRGERFGPKLSIATVELQYPAVPITEAAIFGIGMFGEHARANAAYLRRQSIPAKENLGKTRQAIGWTAYPRALAAKMTQPQKLGARQSVLLVAGG
jgi:hypothetical protein